MYPVSRAQSHLVAWLPPEHSVAMGAGRLALATLCSLERHQAQVFPGETTGWVLLLNFSREGGLRLGAMGCKKEGLPSPAALREVFCIPGRVR